ncbi:MAG: aldose 1-epimerase family protein [Spirochaetes bacterium]|nr:aldose 1-epimerase family protein [Spirochaetota bacterium]
MLFQGKQYSRSDILRRVGDIAQIACVTACELRDGPEKGVAALDVRAGSLRFTVLPDRGMDIGYADYNGIPLACILPAGFSHPAYYEPEGLGWLRGFYAGLLTTCGLATAGAPSSDNGVALGLHGRLSVTPARNVSYGGEWDGDEYRLFVQGTMRETRLFGENIALTRRISITAGSTHLTIHDTVENLGYGPTEHMMLYHINIGFPVVDAATKLAGPVIRTTPRDAAAQAGEKEWNSFTAPVKGYKEQCFYHTMKPSDDGIATMMLHNKELNGGMGVYVSYDTKELPEFTEWKMTGEGAYVVGLEPGNCRVEGRAKERERGTLTILGPGERRSYTLELGVRIGS